MELSRREFLKASGAGAGGIFILGALSPNIALAGTASTLPLKKKVKETTTICCYCGVGCGAIVNAYEDGIIWHQSASFVIALSRDFNMSFESPAQSSTI